MTDHLRKLEVIFLTILLTLINHPQMASGSDSASTQNPFSSYSGTLNPWTTQLSTRQVAAFTANPNIPVYILGASPALGTIITLPSVASAAGARWTFIVGAAQATTWVITAPGAVLRGTAYSGVVGPAAAIPIAGTTITIALGAQIGAQVQIVCDGTSYYVQGQTPIANGFVIA